MKLKLFTMPKFDRRLKVYLLGLVLALVGGGIILLGILLSQNYITSASETTPDGVTVSPVSGNAVQLKWKTSKEIAGVVEYGTDASKLDGTAYSVGNSTQNVVELQQLKPDTTYYFRLKINDQIYDNNGSLWSFTTGPVTTPTPTGDAQATPSATISGSANTGTPTVTRSTTVLPTGSIGTPAVTSAINCQNSNCSQVQGLLGKGCSIQDYMRCLYSKTGLTPSPSPTFGPSPTPTITLTPTPDISSCTISWMQGNSCSSFSWYDMIKNNTIACGDNYTKYFVQCQSTSFDSSETPTWFCNQTTTSSNISLPCSAAPSPAPGQQIFCRVRAETATGGSTGATAWVYANKTCTSSTPTPTPDISTCDIDFIQSNSCNSWTWDDMLTNNVTACGTSFARYYVQCKSSSFSSTDAATWYCNETATTNSVTVPCGTAPTPIPGGAVFCRVRAETSTGGSTDATDWVTGNTTCGQTDSTNTDCALNFFQANNCNSFYWDNINQKLPECSATFSHYFLQCKTIPFPTNAWTGTWYCNETTTNDYLDLPCANAPTPATGANIYCRVRAEDAEASTAHSTDWIYAQSLSCP
ncbi:hypothetical protein A2966_05010 [Candidatus Roizmanbacteria bacterium RIFCSPLOWO2_01_FULL_41_22]|uniref:Fibronectin type-III domain-containing protein n=1 Tax=Candidatus Roizmanbacteria bacterium RIFCSPLOWO2_01_FULL_41_22 TaxID=1802067 RepID=A0A1F7J7S7_9BACT|nr:MAG: hypothetical protein A2966_05010 [Candidatus Roizmanbacteria bacterium RIFCSPLOWO2_01_FULL_41_22]